MAEIEDILSRVLVQETTGCWEWQGPRQQGGYGIVHHGGRKQPVYRVLYTHFIGPIPPGREIDHLCRNRLCCRPEHLEAVTHRENMLRGQTFAARHALKTHCPHGHEYTEKNTRVYRGMRFCRECHRLNARALRRVKQPG